MRFGVQYWRFDWPGGPAEIGRQLGESARVLEDAGASNIWLMDHYFQMDMALPAEQPMLEGYTTLGYLAASTRRADLGLLVTGVTYRHPGLLAKIVSTLDVLSGGRATLGLGAAWYEREHHGLGVPFPIVRERFERMEETIEILQQMWSGEVGPWKGKHHDLSETICQPLPLRKPPILIGGGGEQKTLRLVARYADACNLFPQTPKAIAEKLDVLRRHCDTEGTDYDRITKSMLWLGDSLKVELLLKSLTRYADAGIDTVYFGVSNDPVAYAEEFARVTAPRVSEI